MTRIGLMDKLVQVQKPSRERGGLGDPKKGWTTVAEVFMEIQPARTGELVEGERTESRITHVLRSYAAGLEALKMSWRILFEEPVASEARVFHLVSKRDVRERHFDLELGATEVEGEPL